MADQDALLNGLREYCAAVVAHNACLRQGLRDVTSEWLNLEQVYAGDAASEFRNLWMRTAENFQVYLDRSERMVHLLEERIAVLQAANRADRHGG